MFQVSSFQGSRRGFELKSFVLPAKRSEHHVQVERRFCQSVTSTQKQWQTTRLDAYTRTRSRFSLNANSCCTASAGHFNENVHLCRTGSVAWNALHRWRWARQIQAPKPSIQRLNHRQLFLLLHFLLFPSLQAQLVITAYPSINRCKVTLAFDAVYQHTKS